MKFHQSKICAAIGAAIISILFCESFSRAAILTWDASGSNPTAPTDGAGNWDTDNPLNTVWSNGTSDAVWSSGNTASFGSNNGAANTVTIDDGSGTVSVAGLTFNPATSGNYTINSASTQTLTLTSPTITVAPTLNPTINAQIVGSAGLSLVGGGSLTLGANNTYTGDTIVDGASTLVYSANNTGLNVLTYGATPTASTASTTPSTVDLTNANATSTGLLIQTNSSTANQLKIGAGKTLTVNGAMTVGVADVYEENTSGVNTVLSATGGGTLIVNGGNNTTGNFQVALPRSNTPGGTDPVASADLSGLNSFTYATVSTGEFRVGQGGNDSANVKLANSGTSPTNTIQAASVRIGDTSSPNPGNNTGNNGSSSTLSLGGNATNIIDANQITIGNGKSGGTLNFLSGSGGTLTIANQAGTGNANITMGNASSASNSAGVCLMDLTGHSALVNTGTAIIGRLGGATGGTAGTGQINFDTGTFNVANSLQLGGQSSTNNTRQWCERHIQFERWHIERERRSYYC